MLMVDGVDKSYRKRGWFLGELHPVLRGVSFACEAGSSLGIIGESGSGKSTLGRLLLGLEKPDRGKVELDGIPVADRRLRGGISAVFQDYASSINPFFTVEEAILEPVWRAKQPRREQRRKVDELLRQVGLPSSYGTKFPHELSGGEAQRVCIARAIATEPRWIVFDEAVNALDASVQLQVLDLLKALRVGRGIGYIFITHDIQAAAYLCDDLVIFKAGRIEERISVGRLAHAQSDYAKKLLRMVI
ncbi:ABC transporter ATP-binding protein [Paenibacillus xanthanilyticus]|uniref:ABC transporter ATP-binding protein n=1 Tax=Paenibacillus xanthanilyticus TaxID=1783531 RepID=A0ABV8JXH1_9BACL